VLIRVKAEKGSQAGWLEGAFVEMGGEKETAEVWTAGAAPQPGSASMGCSSDLQRPSIKRPGSSGSIDQDVS